MNPSLSKSIYLNIAFRIYLFGTILIKDKEYEIVFANYY